MVVRGLPSLADAEVDRIFHALADTTRRDILDRVIRGEQSVSSLAREYPMSFAAVQKHVAVLQRAALISKQRRGKEQIVHAEVGALRRAAELLDRYEQLWRHHAAAIEQLLAEDRSPAGKKEGKAP
ncbi:MAG: winged helix-turn-helix transcriptional regulator [Micromonosporaceae bacterium]|nr:winged helix-turn-helix transcriptional regulator [Micromonosporaceae bacterium]